MKQRIYAAVIVTFTLVATLFFTARGLETAAAKVITKNASTTAAVATAADCDQKVELEFGTTDVAYPVAIVKPNRGECGSGFLDRVLPDKVLVYNTPGRGQGHPDNLKIWSNLSWVRGAINVGHSGKLDANGMCSGTTRVCIGTGGRVFGLVDQDLRYLYLWRKKS